VIGCSHYHFFWQPLQCMNYRKEVGFLKVDEERGDRNRKKKDDNLP